MASRSPPSFAELRRSLLYSEELGIRLPQKDDREYFKWFLASLLFGARIPETIAKRTYRAFARHRLLTPRRIRTFARIEAGLIRLRRSKDAAT